MSYRSKKTYSGVALLRAMHLKTSVFILPVALFLILCGLYQALLVSPADYLQGDNVRIMYLHVPFAWIGMASYVALSLFSAAFLLSKRYIFFNMSYALAPIGAVFTLLCIITGSIWGKSTWGAWWVWDARLTSMLLLLFIYVGYVLLSNSFNSSQMSASMSSYFAVFGAVNIPVIKFSVDLWTTLHQKSSFFTKNALTVIDSSMLVPLLLMLVSLTLLSWCLWIARLTVLVDRREF